VKAQQRAEIAAQLAAYARREIAVERLEIEQRRVRATSGGHR
jgi:hypothetical protein